MDLTHLTDFFSKAFGPLGDILAKSPILVIFAIAAIGYPIGRIKVRGASLGIAALLFVGVAFGAIDKRFELDENFYRIGLALFVYTVGLTSSPGFFAALNRRGIRINILAMTIIVCAGLLCVAVAKQLHLGVPMGVGLFTGSYTNSPALAACVEVLKSTKGDASAPVVGYSLAYPFGVIGPMLALLVVRKLFRIDFKEEAKRLPATMTGKQKVQVRSIRVLNAAAVGPMGTVMTNLAGVRVAFGRIRRGGELLLPTGKTEIQVGDEITAVATPADLDRATELLGAPLETELSLDHSEFDFRRVFVSNEKIVGRPLRDLNLPGEHGAVITRIRRGDLDLVPDGNTVLELGDRVRFTCRRDSVEKMTKLFGDSYRQLSEVDLLNFSLGLAIGLALGSIPFPLPGGIQFKLGFAGGPLVTALILGKLQRTGPIVWNIPYSANLTIRQLGLLLFAAGIGTIAGQGFAKTIVSGAALPVLGAAVVISFVMPFLLLTLGLLIFKMPLSILSGVMSGTYTQPVLLAYSTDQTGNDAPSTGYATVYPFATILKIVLAQLLVMFFR